MLIAPCACSIVALVLQSAQRGDDEDSSVVYVPSRDEPPVTGSGLWQRSANTTSEPIPEPLWQ
jgi:hypothetical protein